MFARKIFTLLLIVSILTSCTIARAIKYGNAAVDDYTVFVQDSVHNGVYTPSFTEKSEPSAVDTLKLKVYRTKADTLLQLTVREMMDYYNVPSAAIMLQDDAVVFEHYSGGWTRESQSCIFSVTKTITSMLCGVAIKDGHIRSVTDYVTDYIPELKSADPNFSKLKIEHLLDMTAGLDFDENYRFNPFTKMAKLYMGNNALKTLKSLKFSHNPGENYSYDSATTAILGLVIERATGRPYANYLSEKIWKPLGMERGALMGLDDKRHRVAKSYAGLTKNVRDLAKIGQLFMNNGNWNGVQILDSAYVARCLSPHNAGIEGKQQGRYSYSWYWGVADEEQGKHKYFDTLKELEQYYKDHPEKSVCKIYKNLNNGYFAVQHNGGYWAFGLYGQVLYVNPEKRFIGVFLGADRMKDFNLVFDAVCNNQAGVIH